VQADALNIVWRARGTWEGCDLGIRLVQSHAKSLYRCHLTVAVPLFVLFSTGYTVGVWLPPLLIWWSKPWLDRTILFALSRAVFDTPTAPADVWRARRTLWWAQLPGTLTLRRLSASRSFTQPIHQLEGLRGEELRNRIAQVATRYRGTARIMTHSFAAAEFSLYISLCALLFWLTPRHEADWVSWIQMASPAQTALVNGFYALAVLFLEPFYVAAGFGMYLNRRVELEAWDIEQEFRRAFAL
jgi:hypothetical protein